jgi:transcriptional regulator with XRE-family HTH domain
MWMHNPELAADHLANPVDRQVGGRLRSRRIALNMSAESFARASGTTPQRLREWEAGTSRIGAARLLEFAKILDVNPELFFRERASRRVERQSRAERSAAVGFYLSL